MFKSSYSKTPLGISVMTHPKTNLDTIDEIDRLKPVKHKKGYLPTGMPPSIATTTIANSQVIHKGNQSVSTVGR